MPSCRSPTYVLGPADCRFLVFFRDNLLDYGNELGVGTRKNTAATPTPSTPRTTTTTAATATNETRQKHKQYQKKAIRPKCSDQRTTN